MQCLAGVGFTAVYCPFGDAVNRLEWQEDTTRTISYFRRLSPEYYCWALFPNTYKILSLANVVDLQFTKDGFYSRDPRVPGNAPPPPHCSSQKPGLITQTQYQDKRKPERDR